jgi:putative tricarboxylic transport membrane protein
MARYKDIFGGLFWLVVAVGMYYASFSIRVLTIGGGSTSFVGSGFMPRLVAIGMMLLSLTIMWQSWQKQKFARTDVCSNDELSFRERYLPVTVSIGLLIAYIAFMEMMGFVIMTAVYLCGQMFILATPEHRRPVLFVAVSVVSALAIYYTFVEVFQLMLPENRLF